jgi:hypothetical protein
MRMAGGKMSGEQHHKSKRVRYDLVLVPRDDAGHAKSLRFAPWQVYLTLGGSVLVLVIVVLALLVYTPLGILFPLENPGLVNKYSKELVSLNQRMTSLMEQLVELREYNVKLRNALGEKVVATDNKKFPMLRRVITLDSHQVRFPRPPCCKRIARSFSLRSCRSRVI